MKKERTERLEGRKGPELNVVSNMLAGGFSRGLALSLLHPMDVAKTRIQFQRESMKAISVVEGTPYYKNGMDALWSIGRREGARALFKGLGIRWLYIWPSAAVTFTIYEQAKYAVKSREWSILPMAFLFGISVRAFSTLARTPFDIFKQHLQLSGMAKNSPRASISSIYQSIRKEYGNIGLFHSFHVTILRDICFSGTHFLSYELFKHLQIYLSFTKMDILTHGFAGGAAGAVGTLCSIPIDVIKTRLQTQLQLPSQLQKYAGFIDAVRVIYREEGKRAFIRGLGPRLLSTIPASSLTFILYERIRTLFIDWDKRI